MTHDLSKRLSYERGVLLEAQAGPDPLQLFTKWLGEAGPAGVREPAAMSLCTVGEGGRPTSRIVLLRGATEEGFKFFTNYQSRKGRDLLARPHASLHFFWPELERQIRIDGTVHKQSRAESEAYFAERPRDSQLGAWTSQQSSVVPNREALEALFAATEARFEGETVPCPPHWGGYVLRADVFEFWQGRPSRLHDRLEYARTAEGWSLTRLAP